MYFSGVVTGFQLSFTTTLPVSLGAWSHATSATNATLSTGCALSMTTTANAAVGNLTFTNGANLNASVSSGFVAEACVFENVLANIGPVLILSDSASLQFNKCIFSSAQSALPLVSHPSSASGTWSDMTFSNCQLTVSTGGIFNAGAITNLLMNSSTVHAAANDAAIIFINVATISTFKLHASTFVGATPTSSGNASPQPQLTIATSASIEFSESSHFEGLKVDAPSITGSFTISDCTFTDVELSSHLPSNMWTGVKIRQPTTASSVTLYGSSASFQDVDFSSSVASSSATSPAFVVSRPSGDAITIVVAPDRHFSVSKLVVSPNTTLYVANLEVTDSIYCSDAIAPASIAIQSTNTTWNFHSINITNTAILFYSITRFIYTPSEPSKGIVQIAASKIASSPPLISIAWPNASSPPTYMKKYPIFSGDANMGLTPGQEIPVQVVQPDYLYNVSYDIVPFLSFVSHYMAPPSNPISTPTTCDAPIGFQCAPGGGYFSPGPISQPSIILPPNAGVIPVYGNITVYDSIAFSGTGTSIVSYGCVQTPGISIELTKGSTLPKGSVTLITQDSNCTKHINALPVTIKSNTKDSCKKTTVKEDPNAPTNTFAVIFTVDSSSCNTKWIILGSVLGAIIVITTALALVFAFNDKARQCIRPYSDGR